MAKWFFSSVDNYTGWYGIVSCPCCRSPGVPSLPFPPRPNTLCPFIPNRLVDKVVNNIVEKLEGVDEKFVVESDKHDATYMHERSKAKDAPPPLHYGLSEWGKSGQKRTDWIDKATYAILLPSVKHISDFLAELKICPQAWSHGDVVYCRPMG